jgi:alkylated DNA repair protein (DNA oxidative demethylase)
LTRIYAADLFADTPALCEPIALGPDAWLLRSFARPPADALADAIARIAAAAPFRHLETPGGFHMSVAITNCGSLGWVSDRRGYRYTESDPASGRPWPAMPPVMAEFAAAAALAAGFRGFLPDACLINKYVPGARMSLHQDKDECDFESPIVSVSLGLPAVFLFGGAARADKAARWPLEHGDVVVWGGASRLRFHGVARVKPGCHETWGGQRVNLTFRRAR